MVTYVDNLEMALKKRETKLVYSMDYTKLDDLDIEFSKLGVPIPPIIKQFYQKIEYLKIESPRHFEVLPLKRISLMDDHLLFFSIINQKEKICFDTSHYNDAGQWDIININNNFRITMTITSYLINKIWAWVDRSRTIWQQEYYF